ncbi:uncharacterized protein LOC105287721 isoform X2 [Ooceraea biroi]|uniref:uncharacterized protein LOC105287721 isoform X2 n=1 Tax=Ooceraea biroi TaxID=2015173 RepID=UPI000F093793|nr:uncharacterized protein LOC105287721 isoform X2 [Ooceraea biroi]
MAGHGQVAEENSGLQGPQVHLFHQHDRRSDLRQKLEIRYEHSSKKHNDAVEKMEVDRYLIIDVRQKAHYDGSKITFDKCINIPQSEIKPGELGYKFANCFHKDKQSFDLFKHRSAQHVDIIILVDWNTTQETLTTSTYLNILKDIFEKCDAGTKHKKIKIFNGSYQEWLMTYPTFTTNSNMAVPEFNDVANAQQFENPDAPCGPTRHPDAENCFYFLLIGFYYICVYCICAYWLCYTCVHFYLISVITC